MHLAILMTNTDESDFAKSHPRDGEKFTSLIQLARPEWTTQVYSVKDGVFPDDINQFDGVMITGSPSSVRNDAPWVAQLLALIRRLSDAGKPMFGACFGHQAIALALGGRVGFNPDGLVHGLTRNRVISRPTWAADLPDVVSLYASHGEQVTALPAGARVLTASQGCDISGFAIGKHIYTTQHHPEMTRGFIAALTDQMANDMGPALTAKAHASLADPSDMAAYAQSIARFFEQAVS